MGSGSDIKFSHNTNAGTISSMFLKASYNLENKDGVVISYWDRPIASKHLLGGFVGYSQNANFTINSCLNEGVIDNRATQVAYASGFVGFAKIESETDVPIVSNSTNNGTVSIGSTSDFIRLGKDDYEAIDDGKKPTVPYAQINYDDYNFDDQYELAAGLFDNLTELGNADFSNVEWKYKLNNDNGYYIGTYYYQDSVASAGGFVGGLVSKIDIGGEKGTLMFGEGNTNIGSVLVDKYTTVFQL